MRAAMAHRATRLVPRARSAAEKEQEATGESIFMGVPGISASFRWHGQRIHYRCAGDGPPLVLVHAPDVGACCAEWRRNMEALSHAFTVFAVDLPGYGMSTIEHRPYTADLYIRYLTE